MRRMFSFLALVSFGFLGCVSAPSVPSIRSDKPESKIMRYQKKVRKLDKPYFYARTKPKDIFPSDSLVTIPAGTPLRVVETSEGDFPKKTFYRAELYIECKRYLIWIRDINVEMDINSELEFQEQLSKCGKDAVELDKKIAEIRQKITDRTEIERRIKLAELANKARTIEIERRVKIAELTNKARTISPQDYTAMWSVYENLLQLDPDNETYREKVDWYKNKVEDERQKKAEVKRLAKIMELEDRVRPMPVSNYNANLDVYEKLLQLDPYNKKYKNKVVFYRTKIDEQKRKEANRRRQKEEERKREIVSKGYVLELLNWHWNVDGGYVKAEGEVKNISERRLENVEVLVIWYNRNNDFVTSDSSIIEYNVLMPDQTSPFRVFEKYNPQMHKALIEFKFLFGNKIPAYKK